MDQNSATYEGQKMYDPKETWPKESIIRIKEYLNTKK